MLYLINGRAALIPWIIFLMGFVIGALGAGMPGATIVGILAFPLARAAGIPALASAMAANAGTVVGINNPWTGQSGIVIQNLIANAGQMPERAVRYSMGVFLSRLAMNILIVFVIFIATKSYKAKKMQVDRPKDFEPVQKKTFRLLITCSAVIVVCVTLGMLFPESEICQTLSAIGQPQIVMTFGAIIAMLMKVGPADKAVKALPVNTVLMISGFTMMMSVAQNAGLVDALAHVMSGNIPDVLLKPMFLVVAGCMSFFCSGTGVVFPLLFPIALPLSQATGINPGAIIVCMTAGSMLSSLSPFSTGGAMMLAGCRDQEAQDQMSNQLIAVAVTALLSGAVLAFLGFFDLFAL